MVSFKDECFAARPKNAIFLSSSFSNMDINNSYSNRALFFGDKFGGLNQGQPGKKGRHGYQNIYPNNRQVVEGTSEGIDM